MSISSFEHTKSTGWDGDYVSELDPDVQMCMENDMDTQESVDLDGDVDMEPDGDADEEEDVKKEDEEEVEVEVEDEEEDQDENNGNEPRTLGQGEMIISSADDADTMVDYWPIVLPEQRQEMREHVPQPQSPALAPRP